jgi:hypothetical protein
MIHKNTSATFTSAALAFPSAQHATYRRAHSWAAWPKAQHGVAAANGANAPVAAGAWAAKWWR